MLMEQVIKSVRLLDLSLNPCSNGMLMELKYKMIPATDAKS